MMVKCTLSCQNPSQRAEFNLSDCLMDMSSVDFSKCAAVFEDGSYEIYFVCEQYNRTEVKSVAVCVNGEQVGDIILSANTAIVEGSTRYRDDIFAKQPFLLHYDLIAVSFILSFVDGSSKEYFTDFLLCVSKNQEDATNIQNMLQELIAFDDSQVGEWIFSDGKRGASNSLYEGKWNKRAYKSLSSYIQLLEQVIACYKNNFAYFRMQGKHTIKQSSVLVPYEKVKKVSRDSFNWIMQNADQLANVPYSSGVQYQGKNYLPYHLKTDASQKSWDVYENRIVISFLHTVLLNAKQIFLEFDRDILNEERIISRIHGSFPKEYCAPIITIKSLQISFCRILLGKLNHSIDTLQNLYTQYETLFDVQTSMLTTLPRKTSRFCEIKPYAQVFKIIVHWFQYGEYSLEKERLILQVKTLDKLFEYYCLLQLLKLLADNGYHKADIQEPAFKYLYTSADGHYQNEQDVANTYVLSRNHITATLYYQPVISAFNFENGLTLYRTTSKKGYYTPDFVLKFSFSEHDEEYIIFDAKFASRDTIKNFRLPEVIRKYSCELCVAANSRAPKMVWILQGRVNSNEKAIWRYHNSPLVSVCRPATSFGIVSVNTTIEIRQRLWNEIKSNILLLQ
ncbi:MAG: nuclease domain-containing protein [Flavonifractor plautii]|nr:hypothetical protein [Clostridiales bacterium]MDU3781432.1 nuclease domain-containing protein [Flavonifractor plautii]